MESVESNETNKLNVFLITEKKTQMHLQYLPSFNWKELYYSFTKMFGMPKDILGLLKSIGDAIDLWRKRFFDKFYKPMRFHLWESSRNRLSVSVLALCGRIVSKRLPS